MGQVVDTLKDERMKAFHNGEEAIFLRVFRQSGSNTIAVADAIIEKVQRLNESFLTKKGKPKLSVVLDLSKFIRFNVEDVQESIFFGITLPSDGYRLHFPK